MVKKILISLGVAVVIIIIGVVLLTRYATAPDSDDVSVSPSVTALSTPVPSASVSPTVSVQASSIKTYTLADVVLHPDQTSCWSAINGSVYDLTTWIQQHPGGASRILSICGKDGSVVFTNKHDSDQKQQDILKTFLIGKLTL